MSKKTSAYRAYEFLQTLPVGSTTNTQAIMKKMPSYVSRAAVSNLLWNMSKDGFLIKHGYKNWTIMARTKNYHKVHKFAHTNTVVPREKRLSAQPELALRRKLEPAVIREQAEAIVKGGVDVIEDLLTAMAKAEPELRRLQKLDEKVKALLD